MNRILFLFKAHNLKEIYQKYDPNEIAKNLSFTDGMLLGYKLLFNDERDDELRKYAVRLIEAMRQNHPIEWSENWRNDIFLGDAYYLIMNCEECYKAYKRVSEKQGLNSPVILVSLAGCYLSPGSPVTLDEAEKLLLEALDKEKTIEAATLIRGIYKTKGNDRKFLYWDKILERLEKENAYIKDKWPSFLEKSSS